MADKLEPIAVSISQAAELLGVSRPTVYQYAKMADFPAAKIGGRVLVSVEGLRAWVRRQVEVTESA